MFARLKGSFPSKFVGKKQEKLLNKTNKAIPFLLNNDRYVITHKHVVFLPLILHQSNELHPGRINERSEHSFSVSIDVITHPTALAC